jgi:hypothetical protein
MQGRTASSKSRIFLSEEEVRVRLAPHLAFLTSLPHRAVEKYMKEVAPAFATRWPRARAATIHAIMVEAMAAYDAANMVFARGRWLWRVAADLVVQFKMLGSAGLPRNFPTPAALAFDAQTVLTHMPAGMRVTLGYTLDEDSGEVMSVRVVAQDGPRSLFSFEPDAVQAVLPLIAPISAGKPSTPRRLRAKNGVTPAAPKKKTGTGEGDDT